MEEPRRLRDQVIMLTLSVIASAVIVWTELPPGQRMMITLTVRAKTQGWLHRAARRAGRLGMGNELAGHRPASAAGYGAAYRLARLRDRL